MDNVIELQPLTIDFSSNIARKEIELDYSTLMTVYSMYGELDKYYRVEDVLAEHLLELTKAIIRNSILDATKKFSKTGELSNTHIVGVDFVGCRETSETLVFMYTRSVFYDKLVNEIKKKANSQSTLRVHIDLVLPAVVTVTRDIARRPKEVSLMIAQEISPMLLFQNTKITLNDNDILNTRTTQWVKGINYKKEENRLGIKIYYVVEPK